METNEPELPPIPAPIPQPERIVLSPGAGLFTSKAANAASLFERDGIYILRAFSFGRNFIGTVLPTWRVSPGYNNVPLSAFSMISVLYIAMDVLYFFFPFYLYRFADRVKRV